MRARTVDALCFQIGAAQASCRTRDSALPTPFHGGSGSYGNRRKIVYRAALAVHNASPSIFGHPQHAGDWWIIV